MMAANDLSIVKRLFFLRRQAIAALTVLRDCGNVERQLRLAARIPNVSTEDSAYIVAARATTIVRRWRAQGEIIKAGCALFVLCAEIDVGDMTIAQKLDLLGCRHRAWGLPTGTLAEMIGEGLEVAVIDVVGTPDTRVGPLMLAGIAAMDQRLLDQHEALRPVVQALEAHEAERQRVEAVEERVKASGALAMPAPGALQ